MYKALVDPLKEEVEALKEKIREMDTDITYYKTKLNESKNNVEEKLTTSMYLLVNRKYLNDNGLHCVLIEWQTNCFYCHLTLLLFVYILLFCS